jgi:hypothetical protein
LLPDHNWIRPPKIDDIIYVIDKKIDSRLTTFLIFPICQRAFASFKMQV